jgi:hypothetical protein
MAGFSSFDALIYARSSLSYGQDLLFQKTKAANTAASTFYTLWGEGGVQPAGSRAGAAATAAQCTDATTGAIPFSNAGSNRNLFAHSVAALQTSGNGTLFLWDRLLYYPGIDHSTAGATALTNGVALPRYTTGAGVYAFLEVTTVIGAAAHTMTLTYTDDAGNAGNSTGAVTITPSAPVESLCHAQMVFPLATGDKGIRSVQTITQATAGAPTGVSTLVLARLLATIPLPTANVSTVQDLVRGPQIALPEINDDACLMWTYLGSSAGTTPTFSGMIYATEN